MRIAILWMAALSCALAQDIKMPPGFDKLAAKAEESVDVTLDGGMLQLAGRFLSEKNVDEARAKRLISGLTGIYVRSLEFAREGEYSAADVEAFRSQLQTPAWSRIVGVRSRRDGETAEVYLKNAAGGQIGGLVVLATEPKQLTIVNIVGMIRPEDLADLGGQFGIPRIEVGGRKNDTAPPPKGGKERE